MSNKLKLWAIGILLAAIGIVLARVVAPTFESWTQLGIYIAGIIVALAGLGIIMYSMKR